MLIVANKKKLRESLATKTDQAVYEGASIDLLQLIHDFNEIGIQTKTDKHDKPFEKILRHRWWHFQRLYGMLTIPEGLVKTVTIFIVLEAKIILLDDGISFVYQTQEFHQRTI